MEAYSLILKPSIEKDLRRLPNSVVERVLLRIEELHSDPFPRQAVKLTDADKLYRLRVGDYRRIYEVDTRVRQVIIHYVRHRRDAYDVL